MPLILSLVPCLAGLFSVILLVTTEMIPAWKRQYHWYRFWRGQKKVSILYQWYKIDTIKLPLLIPCFDTNRHFLPATRKWYSKFGMIRTTLRAVLIILLFVVIGVSSPKYDTKMAVWFFLCITNGFFGLITGVSWVYHWYSFWTPDQCCITDQAVDHCVSRPLPLIK